VAYGPQVVLYDGRREAFGGEEKGSRGGGALGGSGTIAWWSVGLFARHQVGRVPWHTLSPFLVRGGRNVLSRYN